MNNIEIEWKEIAKDGMPKAVGYYVFSNKYFVKTVNILFEDGADAVGLTHWYGPIDLPKKPEKLLTFTEALRVVLDGGKVKTKYDNDIEFCLENLGCIWEENIKFGILGNIWIIVKHAPKPKMPAELREFKDKMKPSEIQAEQGILQVYCKENIFEVLKPLLDLYEKES